MKSILSTTLRVFRRDRFYSIINLIGLAIGIATFLLISGYVRDDLRWDKMHSKADNLYRVVQTASFAGVGEQVHVWTPVALGPALLNDVPEIVNMTRFKSVGETLMRVDDVSGVYVDKIELVDSGFFEMFDFPVLYGSTEGEWKENRAIVLEKTTAEQLFGDINPVGRVLTLVDTLQYVVSAVVDLPEVGSHINFNVLLPIERGCIDYNIGTHWHYNNNTRVDVELVEGADYEQVSERIASFMLEYLDSGTPNAATLSLQPFSEAHLYSAGIKDNQHFKGNIRITQVIFLIGVIILLLAIINHINLAIARTSRRAREIGVRKTVGADRWVIIRQLIGESVLMAIPAAIIAAIIVQLMAASFGELTGRTCTINVLDGGFTTFLLLGMIPVIGLLSGIYPAIVISRLKPVEVLKGSHWGVASHGGLRRVLIIFQFTTSVAVIIVTSVIYRQILFAFRQDPGFNREQVWVIQLHESDIQRNAYALRDRIALLDGVVAATPCSDYMVGHTSSWSMEPEGTGMDNWVVTVYSMDEAGQEVFGLRTTEGRFLSDDFPGDPFDREDTDGAVVINEAVVKDLGWENPIGKTIDVWGSYNLTVVGVVEDFQVSSIKEERATSVIFQNKRFWQNNFIAIRLSPEKIDHAIAEVEKMWKADYPGRPFSSFFADDHFNGLYESERKLGNTLMTFSIIICTIAFLGLLALAVHSTERRKREIAIRRVLGASRSNIHLLLTKEFVLLLAIANLIAWPLAFYASSEWLKGYAYKVPMDVIPFVLTGLATLLFAVMIVVLQAGKTVDSNPANVIRQE